MQFFYFYVKEIVKFCSSVSNVWFIIVSSNWIIRYLFVVHNELVAPYLVTKNYRLLFLDEESCSTWRKKTYTCKDFFTTGLSVWLLDWLMAARKVKRFFFNTSRFNIKVCVNLYKLFVSSHQQFYFVKKNRWKCRTIGILRKITLKPVNAHSNFRKYCWTG